MKPQTVKKWCAGRYGRMAKLAEGIGVSKQAVYQWSRAMRPIPLHREKPLRQTMDAIAAAEREQMAS